MATRGDEWACTVCRSINGSRSDRCYRCHTPRAVAGVRPSEVPFERGNSAVPITGVYRSSETRAVFVTIATLVFIVVTAAAAWTLWTISDLRAAGEGAPADELLRRQTPLLAGSGALAVVALLLYGAWISRAVENLPALGLGFSRVGPTMAFFEPLIPGLNLYALPARVGEVLSKLEGSGRGHVLIGIGWLLGFVPIGIAAWAFRIGRFTETGAELIRTIGATLLIMFGLQAVALVIGLFVIWHVEGLFRVRAAQPRSSVGTSA